MRLKVCFLELALLVVAHAAALDSGAAESAFFNEAEVRDKNSLEITVLQDWRRSDKYPKVQQKLIEITVCEWWTGQKVRLPVTLNAPIDGLPCKNLVIANQGLAKRAFTPSRTDLGLIRDHGVGVVLIGMGTIDAMEPSGELHLGMKARLLETKDVRYTPAWIWGMSQMRALTAATTEPDFFQAEKVLATGGSKRGVASAAAGIHDDRFTAIFPVVAPILKNPGTPTYVIGTEPRFILERNKKFFADLAAGKLDLPDTALKALEDRNERRSAIRVTRDQTDKAGWTDDDISMMSEKVWDISRITHYLNEVEERDLDYLYLVGTNDSVSPGLLDLAKQFPDFPVCIIPGGQHGGPNSAGFSRQTPRLPLASANYKAFAQHHFFNSRSLPAKPELSMEKDEEHLVTVIATFAHGLEPEINELWWSFNRNEPYTLPYEYDRWESIPMKRVGKGKFAGSLPGRAKDYESVEYLTLHTQHENELPLTFSSTPTRLPTLRP